MYIDISFTILGAAGWFYTFRFIMWSPIQKRVKNGLRYEQSWNGKICAYCGLERPKNRCRSFRQKHFCQTTISRRIHGRMKDGRKTSWYTGSFGRNFFIANFGSLGWSFLLSLQCPFNNLISREIRSKSSCYLLNFSIHYICSSYPCILNVFLHLGHIF